MQVSVCVYIYIYILSVGCHYLILWVCGNIIWRVLNCYYIIISKYILVYIYI